MVCWVYAHLAYRQSTNGVRVLWSLWIGQICDDFWTIFHVNKVFKMMMAVNSKKKTDDVYGLDFELFFSLFLSFSIAMSLASS